MDSLIDLGYWGLFIGSFLASGLKQVEQQNPDVIICDVQAEMYGPAWLSPQPVIGWEDSLHTGSVGWAAGNGSNAG